VERWTIRPATNLGAYGDCRLDTKVIRIRAGLSREEAIATIIHEVLHASLPDLGEEAVARTEENIVRALEGVGLA
jgi:hypothetical protein